MTGENTDRDGSGIEMREDGIDSLLREQGYGVLSLSGDRTAYGVPVSFGYDGERLFVRLLQFGPDSKKESFIETTDVATLTVYDVESEHDWRSVVLRGRLVDVPEDEHEYADRILEENGWFPTLFPPTEPVSSIRRVELQIADVTGLAGERHQD